MLDGRALRADQRGLVVSVALLQPGPVVLLLAGEGGRPGAGLRVEAFVAVRHALATDGGVAGACGVGGGLDLPPPDALIYFSMNLQKSSNRRCIFMACVRCCAEDATLLACAHRLLVDRRAAVGRLADKGAGPTAVGAAEHAVATGLFVAVVAGGLANATVARAAGGVCPDP